MYSYYLGMISTEKEQKQYDSLVIDNNNMMNGQTKILKAMKTTILQRLNWTQSLSDFDEIHHENKFITKIKTWLVSDDNQIPKQESLRYSPLKSNELFYDFGFKFYYAKKYKNNQKFYVNSKHKSLKDEMTLNSFCNINLKDWNNIYYRAV